MSLIIIFLWALIIILFYGSWRAKSKIFKWIFAISGVVVLAYYIINVLSFAGMQG